MIVCPECSAFVKLTYTGVERSKVPWIGWDPVVKGQCWRHGEVKPVGWYWEEIFGDWDPDEAASTGPPGPSSGELPSPADPPH